MEIERKYSVKKMPEGLDNYTKIEIEQGYLCIKPTVRIRKSNGECELNYKWKELGVVDDNAIHNIEKEMFLTNENYDILYKKVEGNVIKKTRYKIPLEDNHTVELDVFHGNLEGLVFAEIEFDNDLDVNSFIKPDWLGDNISKDKRYDNTLLSKIDKFDKESF